MRASRLLQILLLLQNRGRLTCPVLAAELEVSTRTIIRDVDALTEAGLPIVVLRGNQGGIELGFNYRMRLTGLAADEAEALAIILASPVPALGALGIGTAAARAIAKLRESFPDGVREKMEMAARRFRFSPPDMSASVTDPRLPALAAAIRARRIVYLRASSTTRQRIHPENLTFGPDGWTVTDGLTPDQPLRLAACGDINISAKHF